MEPERLSIRDDMQRQNIESDQPAKRKSHRRERKGARRKQIFKMYLPQNWQSLHPRLLKAMRSSVCSLGPCKSLFLFSSYFSVQKSMDKALTHEEIDQAAGVLFPFYDAESDIIYVAGKGDTSIR